MLTTVNERYGPVRTHLVLSEITIDKTKTHTHRNEGPDESQLRYLHRLEQNIKTDWLRFHVGGS